MDRFSRGSGTDPSIPIPNQILGFGSYDPSTHPARTYAGFYSAYEFFNCELFDGKLPNCLITVQRHTGAYGYFSGKRFTEVGASGELIDEIALNPAHFIRPVAEILSTLVHEMVHLEQHHFGEPGRGGYHNLKWARRMRIIGLIPSNTGMPGGKETGDRVDHYIVEGGPFDRASRGYIENNASVLYQDRAYARQDCDDRNDEDARGTGMCGLSDGKRERTRLRKAASKTRFTCSDCEEQTAWAKASARLRCGDCGARMDAEPT